MALKTAAQSLYIWSKSEMVKLLGMLKGILCISQINPTNKPLKLKRNSPQPSTAVAVAADTEATCVVEPGEVGRGYICKRDAAKPTAQGACALGVVHAAVTEAGLLKWYERVVSVRDITGIAEETGQRCGRQKAGIVVLADDTDEQPDRIAK